jgi:aerobic C4-dicarboxylate transport protein
VIVAPVIFCTVVVGIASIGNLARAGGLALKALFYFLVATVVALTIGLLAANIFNVGGGFTGTPSETALESAAKQVESGSAADQGGITGFLLNDLLPTSFLGPFVENEVLRVLVLAILTACSVSLLAAPLRKRVVGSIETIAKVVFGIIKLIMWAAPVAAFGGMAYTVAQFGTSSLTSLLQLMGVFWGTCLFFVVAVLGLVSWWAGFNIFKVIRLIKDELLIIVGTSSSESVLPRLLTKLEAAGASKQTVGLVIPTGYSFNLDGTCIYLTLGALFIIHAGGETLPIGLQIGLALLMVLTSKGAAGITGAGLVTLAASLQAFGGEFFTAEAIAVGIALIIGIDRVMSEGRALTNCIGNVVATLVIARWNGELDRERLAAVLDDPSLVNEAMELEHGGGAADEESAEEKELVETSR